MPTIYPAYFDGQQIFGDEASTVVVNAATVDPAQGIPAAIDAFLGNSPGTTQYGADAGGECWLLSGTFTAPTGSGVAALEATLRGYAGTTAQFAFPTGLPWPNQWRNNWNCRFLANEFVPGAVTETAGGAWTVAYKLIVRQSPQT
jgi:hypothetical protein